MDFGVSADEVGFDYTSTLRRSSVPVALSLILMVLLLSLLWLMLTLLVPLFRRDPRSMRSARLLERYPQRAGRQVLLWVGWIVSIWVLARFIHGSVWFLACFLSAAVLLMVDAQWARARAEPSTLNVFLEPRPQNGWRHLVMLTIAVLFGYGFRDVRWVWFLPISLFWLDRALSPDTSDTAPPFSERVGRLPMRLVGVVAMILVAGVALGLLVQLDWTLRLARLADKQAEVRTGKELSFQPFAPFGLIQPQALRVTAFWLGMNPHPLFLEGDQVRSHVLTFFGDRSGVSVFFDTKSNKVLRLPSGSVAIEALGPDSE